MPGFKSNKTSETAEVKNFVEKIKAPSLKSELSASGVCGKCRKRYTAVPVIDRVPQCPNCNPV